MGFQRPQAFGGESLRGSAPLKDFASAVFPN
jgi:hypothetical protein